MDVHGPSTPPATPCGGTSHRWVQQAGELASFAAQWIGERSVPLFNAHPAEISGRRRFASVRRAIGCMAVMVKQETSCCSSAPVRRRRVVGDHPGRIVPAHRPARLRCHVAHTSSWRLAQPKSSGFWITRSSLALSLAKLKRDANYWVGGGVWRGGCEFLARATRTVRSPTQSEARTAVQLEVAFVRFFGHEEESALAGVAGIIISPACSQ